MGDWLNPTLTDAGCDQGWGSRGEEEGRQRRGWFQSSSLLPENPPSMAVPPMITWHGVQTAAGTVSVRINVRVVQGNILYGGKKNRSAILECCGSKNIHEHYLPEHNSTLSALFIITLCFAA